MPIIKCERCGREFDISKLDFQNKNYSRECLHCKCKPKRGEIEKITMEETDAMKKEFSADGIEGRKRRKKIFDV